jgi:chromate reductase
MALKVVVLCGSLRRGSFNQSIARSLPELAPEGMSFALLDGLGTLPHYDADVQAEGFPARVLDMADAIRAADAVAFVTPEYNYSIPGTLKNALDWLSRVAPQPFVKKPTLIQTASPGMIGGARAQYHLRQVLVFLDALPMNKPEIMIGGAAGKISDDGVLHDEVTRQHIKAQLVAFESFVRQVGGKAG